MRGTASRAAVLLRIEKAAKSTATVTSVTAAVGIPGDDLKKKGPKDSKGLSDSKEI